MINSSQKHFCYSSNDRTGWWRQGQSPFTTYQFYLQTSTATLQCVDMAIRATGNSDRRKNQGILCQLATFIPAPLTSHFSQGFDEFMNLVIDDAVEVKQATKIEDEKRRELGASIFIEASNLY